MKNLVLLLIALVLFLGTALIGGGLVSFFFPEISFDLGVKIVMMLSGVTVALDVLVKAFRQFVES